MDIDPINLLLRLVNASGINHTLLEYPYENICKVDGGLRRYLFQDFDYSLIAGKMVNESRHKNLYFITDEFECNYVFLRLPRGTESAEDVSIVIGPYLNVQYENFIEAVVEQNKLSGKQATELVNAYLGIPILDTYHVFESEVIILAEYIFETAKFPIIRARSNLSGPDINLAENQTPEDHLSMAMIEEKYHHEDELLQAVERGDLQEAIIQLSGFKKYHYEQRFTDALRNYKNTLIILNSLLRKAVQRADVHPSFINNLSSTYAYKIESARKLSEFSGLSRDMLRKYCLLVKNHSLRGYTKIIQFVINYISLHLDESLTLVRLSELANVNPSYLSARFKKETGETLTEFINQKRVQQAILLLNSTDLPINQIAERVGVLDENYFSRLFRKHLGKSPRAYRKAIKKNIV